MIATAAAVAMLPWTAVGVGPSQRAVALAFTYGGCQRDPRVVVTETVRTVRFQVTVQDAGGPGVACPAIARLARMAVRLRAPLAGRRILGQSGRSAIAPPPFRPGCYRVPSVVGMAAPDARLALRVQGLRASGARTGEVVRQSPRPWRCLASAPAVVRLVAR